MNIMDLKYRLLKALDVFSYSTFIAIGMVIILLIAQKDIWLLLLTPSILIFSVIGLHYVSKGLLILSKKEGQETTMTPDEYIDKLFGIDGFKMIFIVSAVMICVCGGLILTLISPKMLSFSSFTMFSLIFAAILIYCTYKVSQELSFVIMSVTIVDSMETKKASSK